MSEDNFDDDDVVALDEASARAEAADQRRRRREPLKLPTPRTFAEAVAACALVHALRPHHGWTDRDTPILVGIVAAEDWIGTIRDVLERILEDGKRYGSNAHLSVWRQIPKAVRDDRKSFMRRTRAFALVSDEAVLPEGFALAADGVVSIDAIDARHVQAAAHSFLGTNLGAADAAVIAGASPEEMLALRKGRSLKDSLRRLRAASGETPAARKTTADTPTLDDLHGLSEAGEWGRELATDLADWRAGKIGWEDVDRGILLSGPRERARRLLPGRWRARAR